MSAFIDDYLPSDSINLVGLNLACGGNYTIFKQAGKIVHPLDLLKEEMLRMAQTNTFLNPILYAIATEGLFGSEFINYFYISILVIRRSPPANGLQN